MFCYNASMSEKFHYSKPRKLAALGLAVVSAATLAKGVSGSPEDGRTKEEAKVLEAESKNGVEILDEMIVLREGVNYHKTPKVVPADTGSGSDSGSVEGKIEKGKVMVINRPLMYEDENGKTWWGFKLKTKPNTKKENTKQIAEETYWLDIDELSKQGDEAGLPYYEVYVTGTTDNSSPVVAGYFDKAGNLLMNDENGRLAGQADIIPADQALFLIDNSSQGRLMK